MVEAQQHLLFQPDVELVFEKNIARARTSGNGRWAAQLEQHLELLRACKATSIVQAFEQLLQKRRAELPFDPALPSKSIAALLGGPEEKLAHAQYLAEQASKTTDEQMKDLLQVIRLALEGEDLSQLGRNFD